MYLLFEFYTLYFVLCWLFHNNHRINFLNRNSEFRLFLRYFVIHFFRSAGKRNKQLNSYLHLIIKSGRVHICKLGLILLFCIIALQHFYWLSKKSCSFRYKNSLYKNWQDFLDIRYVGLSDTINKDKQCYNKRYNFI